jgi:aryl-phospho-beta-D-glucosidase BglC (GH1 family)
MFLPVCQTIYKGISIYGLCTESKNFVCSWVNPVEYYIRELKDMGFNSLRIPFSMQYIEEGDFSKLDHVIDEATRYNMTVLMDMHRTFTDHQDFSPFEHGVTMERFVNAWLKILHRYYIYPIVVGNNVFNEFQGTDIEFLKNYTKTVINYIEYYFPNRFTYYLTGHSWAGSLEGFDVEDLPYKDRIHYSVHKYIFSIPQGSNPDTYDYEADWDRSFGKYTEKLIVGEWGFKQTPKEEEWARRFIKYLKKRNIRNSCFWTIAHSFDTGGIWNDDCKTIDYKKLSIIKDLWVEDRRYLRN